MRVESGARHISPIMVGRVGVWTGAKSYPTIMPTQLTRPPLRLYPLPLPLPFRLSLPLPTSLSIPLPHLSSSLFNPPSFPFHASLPSSPLTFLSPFSLFITPYLLPSFFSKHLFYSCLFSHTINIILYSFSNTLSCLPSLSEFPPSLPPSPICLPSTHNPVHHSPTCLLPHSLCHSLSLTFIITFLFLIIESNVYSLSLSLTVPHPSSLPSLICFVQSES